MAKIINTGDLDLGQHTANEIYWLYNGLDCCLTDEIMRALDSQMDQTARNIYNRSLSLQGPVMDMTLCGLRVNQRRRFKVMEQFKKQLFQLQQQFDEILIQGIGMAPGFNWRSPTQLAHLLYDVMGLPVQKKRNAQGVFAPSTDRAALEKLGNTQLIAEPVVAHLLALRDVGKSLGFLETGVDPDGRMRSSFNIGGTNTGRFSSSESDYGTGTNLQNVARDLRSVFVADPGYKFGNLDLEQADSRNLGALCWDAFLDHPDWDERTAGGYLDACEAGDLHTTVCKMCNTHLPWGGELSDRAVADQIFYRDKSYRDGAKVLGHGSNYYGKPPTMAGHTKFPVNLVKAFQQNYFNAFPAIPAYHKYVREQLTQFSFLTTLYGRRRFFYGRPNDDSTLRAAIAYSPQSMTADEINIGILNLWRGNKVQLLVQVHDSILFQYPEEQEDEIIPWALEQLKAPLILKKDRPFVVPTEAKVGWSWGDFDPYTRKDFLDGKCTEDKIGVAKTNPDGLKKYKGTDPRKRVETDTRLSIRGM